jgi:hypothetical protein
MNMVDEQRIQVLEHKLQTTKETLAVVAIIAFSTFLAIPIFASVVGVGTYSEFFGPAWNTTLLYSLLVANIVGYLWSDL